MAFIVKLLSIAVIIYGCVIILRPDVPKKILAYLKKGNRIITGAAIRIVVGIFLIIASYKCSITWIVTFLGTLLVFTGVLAVVLKKETLLKLIEKVENWPARRIMIMGIVTLIIGILLIIAV